MTTLTKPTTTVTDWHAFTRIYAAECRHHRQACRHTLLAVAMAEQDRQRHRWEHYIALAASELQRLNDEDNPVLVARMRAHEAQGWTFAHDVAGWSAQHVVWQTGAYWLLQDLLLSMNGGIKKI